MSKIRFRKFKGKRFTWIGKGANAKVWRVEGREGKRKKGAVIRRERSPAFTRGAAFWMDELDLEVFG